MAEIKVTQYIAAPPDVVFSSATDIEHWVENIDGIARVEVLTDGDFRLGTKFKETRVMFGKEATEEMEVTEFKPPSLYAVEAKSCGSLFYSRFEFTGNDAGTLVTLIFDGQPLTAGAKVMGVLTGWLMKKSVQKCVQEDLLNLKQVIESRTNSGSQA